MFYIFYILAPIDGAVLYQSVRCQNRGRLELRRQTDRQTDGETDRQREREGIPAVYVWHLARARLQ